VKTMEKVPDPEVPAKARTRQYSAACKARILAEYKSLDKAGKGALLRREGLYTSLLAAWKAQRDRGVREPLVLVADAIEIPGNRGTLLRTLDACGGDCLLLTNRRARLIQPKVFRGSRGMNLA
jgi:tRNA G18 (ribose-2'-O)-methylase SpoU